MVLQVARREPAVPLPASVSHQQSTKRYVAIAAAGARPASPDPLEPSVRVACGETGSLTSPGIGPVP